MNWNFVHALAVVVYLPLEVNTKCSGYTFELESTAIEIRVGRVTMFRHSHELTSLEVGIGTSSFHFDHGNFHVSQSVQRRTSLKYFELILPADADASQGKSGESSELDILFFENEHDKTPTATVTFKCGVYGNTRIHVRVPDHNGEHRYNRLWLKLPGSADEFLYGGHAFPMWSREQGVGRHPTVIRYLAELIAGAGGDYHTTYWPQPTFVSSRMFYVHLDHAHYNVLNFTNESVNEIELWEDLTDINIYMDIATSWATLLSKLTGFFGRQPVPPRWIYDGAIIGLQGGKDEVLQKYQLIKDGGSEISAIWIQDWSGKIVTSLGKRVYWNWDLDEQFYWSKPEMKTKLQGFKEEGVRFLSYINPHVIEGSELYQVGDENGYFIKNSSTGRTFLVDFGEFYCGSVDFTNPAAYAWYKTVLKNMVEIGFSGWMADFGGEYLPVSEDMAFHDDSQNSKSIHNVYSYLWAKMNREVYDEAGNGDLFIFMRSGYSGSPGETLMAWAGDQNVDYSHGDGMPSVIPAALSLGMSGMGLSHSDIGGYVSLICMVRNNELLLRWAEMNVFTQVMRTHECNRPHNNWQVYTTNETAEKFGPLTKAFKSLRPYHEYVAQLNSKHGWPTQRPLFFTYADDPYSYHEQHQYMYGPDLLVSPVFEEGSRIKSVYLPPDNWVHLWSGKAWHLRGDSGKMIHVDAPLGRPPVFYREESEWKEVFLRVTFGHYQNPRDYLGHCCGATHFSFST